MRCSIILFSLICCLAGCAPTTGASLVSTGDGGWECIKPTPSAQQWVAASFVDRHTGWILASSFIVMKTTDGGKNWAPQGQRIPKAASDMCFTDRNNGWIVGSGYGNSDDKSGIVLKTTDGGVTWRKVLDGKTDGLRAVCFVNRNVGWAVGGLPSKVGVILKTTDGGETWIEQHCGLVGNERSMRVFEDVSFVDESTGWVISAGRGAHKTTDGGKSWTEVPMPGKGLLKRVQFVDDKTGWILSRNMFRTTDGGKTWTQHTFRPGQDDSKPLVNYDFHFADAQNGVVLSSGEVLRTRDGGKTWTLCPGISAGGVGPKVRMLNERECWIACDLGLYHTSDGGETWQARTSQNGDSHYGVHFLNPKLGWIVGHTRKNNDWVGIALKTEDAGQSWKSVVVPECGQLWRVQFVDERVGWTVGKDGAILCSGDGGDTWRAQSSGTKSFLLGMQFLDASVGWVVGREGVALKTMDGGVTWSKAGIGAMDDMWGVYFVDRNTGWIVGDKGRIMKTSDGGKTWKRQASGVTACIAGIQFSNAMCGWVSDSSGHILVTNNGGETWAKQDSGVEKQLVAIRFVDDQHGWAAGIPAVGTGDGGKSWHKQDAGGAAWDMHFVDKDTGWIVGAWNVLRTTTGGLPGAVWTKKQPDGAAASFGHLVITKKSQGYILAEHPDSRIGIHIKTSDGKPAIGDYIYVHGKIATENGEKIIAADSIDIMCAGWGVLPEKK